jgi:hypothetical protein
MEQPYWQGQRWTKDYFDLDSDNDGIYDLVESGSNASDFNLDGVIGGDILLTKRSSDA